MHSLPSKLHVHVFLKFHKFYAYDFNHKQEQVMKHAIYF